MIELNIPTKFYLNLVNILEAQSLMNTPDDPDHDGDATALLSLQLQSIEQLSRLELTPNVYIDVEVDGMRMYPLDNKLSMIMSASSREASEYVKGVKQANGVMAVVSTLFTVPGGPTTEAALFPDASSFEKLAATYIAFSPEVTVVHAAGPSPAAGECLCVLTPYTFVGGTWAKAGGNRALIADSPELLNNCMQNT